MNYYAIRLKPEQSLRFFGLSRPKRTLTWSDVLENRHICLRYLVDNEIDIRKIYNLQPDIKEWIKAKKVEIRDFSLLELWSPHPFNDFKCTLGDIVIYRQYITSQILLNSGVTFKMLHERYGLTGDIMILLGYSVDDWINLGISESFIETLSEHTYKQIFGSYSKLKLYDNIKKIQFDNC
jgi:hypothetical protein